MRLRTISTDQIEAAVVNGAIGDPLTIGRECGHGSFTGCVFQYEQIFYYAGIYFHSLERPTVPARIAGIKSCIPSVTSLQWFRSPGQIIGAARTICAHDPDPRLFTSVHKDSRPLATNADHIRT
jgi:hypothetical protein